MKEGTGRVLRSPGLKSWAISISVLLILSGARTPEAVGPLDLYLGVIGQDGLVIPVTLYREGVWSTPWPEPAEDPARPSADLPDDWYVYTDSSDRAPIRLLDLVLTQAHCVKNWAFTTDWDGQRVREPTYVREIVGMVSSRPLDLVEESEIPGVEGFREQFGLVSNAQEGQRFRRSVSLGYFQLDEKLVGVFAVRGYAGESYQVYELEPADGQRVVEVFGGGC